MKKALIALVFPLVAHAQTIRMDPQPGVPPLPNDASPVRNSQASFYCSLTSPNGKFVSAYMTSSECGEWNGAFNNMQQNAERSSPKFGACQARGLAVSIAIRDRNFGVSPQMDFQRMQPVRRAGINDKSIKAIINAVYFTHDFDNVDPDYAQYQVTAICLHPESAPIPLK
jgi:hypothetical protein